MNKIDTFTITGMTVEGFKCFAEKQRFDFGSMTSISGHNGQGKSSIADAICYAITGSPFFSGEHSLDRLCTMGGKSMTVELDIDTGDGAIHKLTRSRAGNTTCISIDGINVRQADLSDMFGEKDVFLSIFNPLYFIEVLGDKGRNLLQRHLPAVSHEAVLNGLSESTRSTLDGVQMGSPETLLERVRADIRELESTVFYTEGQRDLLQAQAKEKSEELLFKQSALAAATAAIAKLEAKRRQGFDASAAKQKLTALRARRDELEQSIASGDRLISITAALEKRSADAYISAYSDKIADTKAAIAQLRAQYGKEKHIHDGLAPGIHCPTCKQQITVQNIESVKKAFADSIGAVIAKGRELTAALGELNALDEKARSVFEQFKTDDLQKLQSELDALKQNGDALSRMSDEIQAVESSLKTGNLTESETESLKNLYADKAALEAEITAAAGAENDSVRSKSGDVEHLNQVIREKRELETAVKFYIAERSRMVFSEFDGLSRVKMVLMEVVKTTGEVKDVFKFSYDGKPYKYLSLSEKIKAGIEVSELVKRLTVRNYPLFIDNGESVPVIDNVRPSGQVFVSQVVKGAPLKAEAIGSPAAKKAA